MMIFGLKPHDFEPVFRFVGGRRSNGIWLGRDSEISVIGERVANQPDKDYGAWVSQFYKAVASTGQPRFDIVTAAIQTSHDRSQMYVTRYERLLLPWKTPSEEVFVTMCSKRLGDEATDIFSPSETSNSVVRKLARSS